jgi:adenylate kinase
MPAILPAILLLGPTGSGKSPLGDLLERSGLWGRRCAHFDFGANLRAAAGLGGRDTPVAGDGKGTEAFSPAELETIRRSLATGALLENADFPVAAKILERFIARNGVSGRDLIVLNGLPRHAGQARDLEPYASVVAVVSLETDAKTLRERLRLDPGGDRAGRSDDAPEAVEIRLRIFADRTVPLLEHYWRRGVPILPVCVEATTRPEEMAAILEASRRRVSLPD